MNTTPRKLIAVTTAILMASTSAFAAVKNGASLKGNEYTKGGNNAKGGGVIAWNEYSSVDPTVFSHDHSSGDLTVLKDGDYLVAFTVPLSTINGQRNTHRAELLVNGAAVSTAVGESSYMRWAGGAGNFQDEASDHFAGLVALKANDVLTLKTTPTAATALESFIATCSLYAELVEVDRNVFSATATEIQSGTNLNVEPDTGDQGLVWTSARKGSAYTHSDGDHGITIEGDGNYMVYVNIPLNGSIARGSVGLTVTLNDEIVEGARGQQGYIRNANAHKNSSIHFSGVISAEAGQVLQVLTEQLALAGTVTVQANRAASLFIEKLGDDGLYADSFTGTTAGENLNPANKAALALVGDGSSVDVIDDATYSNEGDNEENIVIKKAGDYLLTFNVTLYSGGGRVNPRFTVEVNGEVVPGATSTAHYIRNSNNHNESTGSFVALLSNLAVDDVVTVIASREGNTAATTSPEGGKVALQFRDAYAAAAGDNSPPKLASFFALGLDGFQANLEDFGLSVDAASIKAVVDGAEAAVTTSKDGTVTSVNYAFASIPTPNSVHPVTLTYSDSAGNSHSHDLAVAITVDYKGIPASFASTTVDKSSRGFIANVTQISTIQLETVPLIHEINVATAEKQLRGEYINPYEEDDDGNPLPYLNEADPDAWDGWSITPVEVDGVINWNQFEGVAIGNFSEDQAIPQIPGWGDSDDGIVAEILGYLELSKGLHTLGVNSDDGFRLSIGPNPKDQLGVIAGEFDGNRASSDTIFNIVVAEGGMYPVRLLWFAGAGEANIEFFSVVDGKKILVNSDDANALKAYRSGETAPYISGVVPGNNEMSKTIEFDFVDADLSVDKGSIKLKLNGEDVAASVSSTDDGASVVYDHGDYLSGGDYTVELSYTESGGVSRVRSHSFSIPKGRPDILLDNPVIYIPFDDTAGDKAVATVGNPVPDMTYANGPELGVPALYPNGVGTAVRFDGSKDQHVAVANHRDINDGGVWPRGALSWEFWFKPEKLPVAGESNTIYEQGGNTRGVHFYLSGTQDSNPTEADLYLFAWNRAQTSWGGTVGDVESATAVKSTVKLGSVYHVAFVLVGDPSGDLEGTLTGYVNGRQIGQVSGVHMLYAHSNAIAFAYAAGQAVTHDEGNRGAISGLGFTGVIDDAVFYHSSLTEEQVAAHFEGGFSGGEQQAIEITSQPQDASQGETYSATFSVEFTGTPLVDVKWFVNGEEAATDAAISDSSFSIVATEANSGAKIKAELTNASGTVTTSEATLTTIIDKVAPVLESVTAIAGILNTVTLVFNEPLDADSATNTGNYKIDGLTVEGATLGADSKTVTLPTSQQAQGGIYDVTVSGVKDIWGNAFSGTETFGTKASYEGVVLADGANYLWKLDETSGTEAKESVGGAPTGAYEGSPDLNAAALLANSSRSAAGFTAENSQRVAIPNHTLLNLNTAMKLRSWEMWIKPGKLPTRASEDEDPQTSIIYEQGGNTRGASIFLAGTQAENPTEADLWFMVWNRAETAWGGFLHQVGNDDTASISTKVQSGETYHIVLVMEGDDTADLAGTLTAYVNGKEVGKVDGGVGLLNAHSDAVAIGFAANEVVTINGNSGAGTSGTNTALYFDGVIDEFAIYSGTALSAEQVSAHYSEAMIEDVIIDFTAPEIVSANGYAGSVHQVAIVFNEGLDAATAGDAANYAVEGLTVNAAALSGDGKTVTLSTSEQASGSAYNLTVSGVKDLADNAANLSATVQSEFSYAQEVISDGPVIYWKLGETEGAVANDEMGNRTAAYTSVTLGADSLVPTSKDGAVHFDASAAHEIKVGDHKLMNLDVFQNKTIELWFKADSLPKADSAADFQPKMMLWEQGGGWKGLNIYLSATDESDAPSKADLYFNVWSHIGGGAASDPAAWTKPPVDLRWGGTTDARGPGSHPGHEGQAPVFVKTQVEVAKIYHVVCVMAGDNDGLEGKLLLYVNGRLVGETGGASQLYNHGNDAGLGAINAGTTTHDELPDGNLLTDRYHFSGTIDEFAEYNAVLNADQIAGRYQDAGYEIADIVPPSGVDGLSSDIPDLSALALESLVAHYDGRTGVETDGNSVISWTPVDGNGDFLNDMTVLSTQRGNAGQELITYDGSGKLTFDDTSVGADGRYLEGTLSNAESKEFTVFWVGNYSADAPFATSGTYVYNIGINNTSHQRDDGKGGFVVEQYNGTTYAGDDITAYDGVTTVWSTVLTADSHAFYANGENLNVGGTPSNNVQANASMLIGAYSSSGYDFVGEVEQLIIFGSALSDADRELVENHLGASAEPSPLLGDNFDSDSSGNWAVHKSTDDTAVTFGYDYSADGIPAAPNSDGSTIGVKFEANIADPTGAEAVSISPAGGNFTGDYQLNFDMWINANGPFPGGGGGSTEFFTAGVGTTGDHLQWAADTADGAWFGVTGEGGSGNSGDFRAHIGGTRQAAEGGAYAAGTAADSRNNHNAHYADAFPGQSPPAAQAAAFPDKQTGAVANGSVGFAWRQVTITKIGDSVTWAIDGVTIATLDQSLGAFTTEGNIFVGYYDAFSSVSDNRATSFGLVDNIRVVEIQTTLPPTLSIVNNGDGTVTVTFEGKLQGASTVNGPWADVEGAVSPQIIPASEAMQYGRAVK